MHHRLRVNLWKSVNMVLYTFTKKINCPKTNGVNDASKCTVNIKEKIKEKFNLIKEKNKYNFASHITHEQNNHLISIFFCSKTGKEETPKISIDTVCNDKITYDAKINYLYNKKLVKCGIRITPKEHDQPHAVKCKNIPTKSQVMDIIK